MLSNLDGLLEKWVTRLRLCARYGFWHQQSERDPTTINRTIQDDQRQKSQHTRSSTPKKSASHTTTAIRIIGSHMTPSKWTLMPLAVPYARLALCVRGDSERQSLRLERPWFDPLAPAWHKAQNAWATQLQLSSDQDFCTHRHFLFQFGLQRKLCILAFPTKRGYRLRFYSYRKKCKLAFRWRSLYDHPDSTKGLFGATLLCSICGRAGLRFWVTDVSERIGWCVKCLRWEDDCSTLMNCFDWACCKASAGVIESISVYGRQHKAGTILMWGLPFGRVSRNSYSAFRSCGDGFFLNSTKQTLS